MNLGGVDQKEVGQTQKVDLSQGDTAKAAAGGGLSGEPSCGPLLPGTELGGDVVRWGADHLKGTAAECCAACTAELACNIWVWCSRCGWGQEFPT